MKSDYFNLEEGAHICTMNAGAMGYIVTQVAVRPEHRGKGAASRLLDKVCEAADHERVRLLLSVDPDGTGLSASALRSFYARRGFVAMNEEGAVMIREPEGGAHDDPEEVDPMGYA
jgi:ribosomal protein S18 acetylase RimI-like enzyme